MVWHLAVCTYINKGLFPFDRANQIYQGLTLVDIADVNWLNAVTGIEEHQEPFVIFGAGKNCAFIYATIVAVIPFTRRERSSSLCHSDNNNMFYQGKTLVDKRTLPE